MFTKLLTLLTAGCSALAAILHLKRKRDAKARKDAISTAVHSGDQDKVTRIHHRLLR